jgi:shikimate dehydrogenase
MKNFALIGYPLGHSLSPIIHTELFKAKNLEAKYELKEIAPENLAAEFEGLKGLCGFNVTIPHKVNIIPLLDELDERAALFGAVNTVKVDENGKTKGYNTDCSGFLNSLKMADIPLAGKVLLCGCGGVARMFAFEAILAGCDLTIAVREADMPVAKKVADEISEKLGKNADIIPLSEVSGGYDLIINATPVGMFPHTDACIIGKEIIEASKAVFDAVYNPSETLFIKYAKDAGIKYSNGLPMLVWQAAVAEEIWNGFSFDFDDIAPVLKLTEKEV